MEINKCENYWIVSYLNHKFEIKKLDNDMYVLYGNKGAMNMSEDFEELLEYLNWWFNN